MPWQKKYSVPWPKMAELRSSLPFRLDVTDGIAHAPFVRETIEILRRSLDSIDSSEVRLPAGVERINPLKKVHAGGKLAIPRSCESATREVLTAPRTKLSELPGIPVDSSLVLVRRFVHYGVVVPATTK